MSQKDPPEFFVGTSGWSYTDWVGPFYPEKTPKGFSRLGFYAGFFDCVEVNSTFYRHFTPDVGEKWLAEVDSNPDFVFTIKLFREFTHGSGDRGSDFEMNRRIVLSFLKPFLGKGKLGGVLVQFSEFFRDNEASRGRIAQLLDSFPDSRLFFELRHKSWFTNEGRDFIGRTNLNVIATDQPELDDMTGFDTSILGQTGYVRLHGRNTSMWKESRRSLAKEREAARPGARDDADRNARYDYLYNSAELDGIEKEILRVKEKCSRIYVVANNHPMGKAVANALELVKRVRNQERVRMPDTVLKYFPELARIALKVDVSPVGDLFS
ncbi:MAG: DUF72 domain-containing protein [Bacteroidetes bacterium]|nr:DUF72 domain-containing protein [Bacteroidota bacterium]